MSLIPCQAWMFAVALLLGTGTLIAQPAGEPPPLGAPGRRGGPGRPGGRGGFVTQDYPADLMEVIQTLHGFKVDRGQSG